MTFFNCQRYDDDDYYYYYCPDLLFQYLVLQRFANIIKKTKKHLKLKSELEREPPPP